MATQAYWDWVAAGRPWRMAWPVREIKERMVAAGWPAVDLGTIGNEETHLKVSWPQDHAPFSFTGWPGTHPYPNVTAIDYMHRPEQGRDCNVLFAYRIAEARAGRTPWTKYLVWRAQRYDVRNGWAPVAASGHYDHIHESIRTDWVDRSIGAWSPLPTGDDMCLTPEDGSYQYLIWRLDAMGEMSPIYRGGPAKGAEVPFVAALGRLEAAAAADETRDRATAAAIAALTEMVKAGGGSVDTAAVLSAIQQAAADTGVQVTRLQAALAASEGERRQLRERLAAALTAADEQG